MEVFRLSSLLKFFLCLNVIHKIINQWLILLQSANRGGRWGASNPSRLLPYHAHCLAVHHMRPWPKVVFIRPGKRFPCWLNTSALFDLKLSEALVVLSTTQVAKTAVCLLR